MLKEIREAIWPMLEKESINHDYSKLDQNDLETDMPDLSVDLARFMYEQEKDRLSRIESKSIVFISLFGAIVIIIIFLLKEILYKPNLDLVENITLMIIPFLILYMLQVMKYSIKALERKSFYSLSKNDFIQKSKREVVKNILYIIEKNYPVINEKVDNMVLAQEFTKRIIYFLISLMVIIIIYSLYQLVGHLNWKVNMDDNDIIIMSLIGIGFVLLIITVFLFRINRKLSVISKHIKKSRLQPKMNYLMKNHD